MSLKLRPQLLLILLAFSSLATFTSCENPNDSIQTSTPVSSTIKTQVIVVANDPNGNTLPGVDIRIGNTVVTTDNKGYAIFNNIQVNSKRFVVSAEKSTYFKALKGISIAGNTAAYYVKFALIPMPNPVTFSATTGGNVVLSSGAAVNFDAGSIADENGNAYSGPVNVYAFHYMTNDPNFEIMIPGGDLLGKDEDGNDVALVSFGMVNVLLQDPSGNPLNLLAGSTAQITMPIAADQMATAQATIPLWYLDEETSLWQEEGEAVKQGNVYIGEVSHFSYWNCDYPYDRAGITGTVVDCDGNPVAGIIVTLNGFMNITTNSSGQFSTWVPAGWNITYQVLAQNNPWLTSNGTLVTFTAVTGPNIVQPNLVINCSSHASATILDCSQNPTSIYALITQGSAAYYFYVNEGNLNVTLPFPGLNTINITNGSATFDTILNNSIGTVQTFNLGSIELCDTLNTGNNTANSFVITGGVFNNQLILLNPFVTEVYPDSGGFTFYQDGYSSFISPYYTLGITVPGSIPGIYLFNPQIGGTFIIDVVGTYYITNNLWSADPIHFNVISVGTNIGDPIVCTFSGDCMLYDYLSPNAAPAHITNGQLTFYRSY